MEKNSSFLNQKIKLFSEGKANNAKEAIDLFIDTDKVKDDAINKAKLIAEELDVKTRNQANKAIRLIHNEKTATDIVTNTFEKIAGFKDTWGKVKDTVKDIGSFVVPGALLGAGLASNKIDPNNFSKSLKTVGKSMAIGGALTGSALPALKYLDSKANKKIKKENFNEPLDRYDYASMIDKDNYSFDLDNPELDNLSVKDVQNKMYNDFKSSNIVKENLKHNQDIVDKVYNTYYQGVQGSTPDSIGGPLGDRYFSKYDPAGDLDMGDDVAEINYLLKDKGYDVSNMNYKEYKNITDNVFKNTWGKKDWEWDPNDFDDYIPNKKGDDVMKTSSEILNDTFEKIAKTSTQAEAEAHISTMSNKAMVPTVGGFLGGAIASNVATPKINAKVKQLVSKKSAKQVFNSIPEAKKYIKMVSNTPTISKSSLNNISALAGTTGAILAASHSAKKYMNKNFGKDKNGKAYKIDLEGIEKAIKDRDSKSIVNDSFTKVAEYIYSSKGNLYLDSDRDNVAGADVNPNNDNENHWVKALEDSDAYLNQHPDKAKFINEEKFNKDRSTITNKHSGKVAKGISAGIPLAAILATGAINKSFRKGATATALTLVPAMIGGSIIADRMDEKVRNKKVGPTKNEAEDKIYSDLQKHMAGKKYGY